MPSPMVASLSGTCCNGWATRGIPYGIGWSTGGRSYGARKFGRETSIRAKRWSPARIPKMTLKLAQIPKLGELHEVARRCSQKFPT